jgi:hypothetical protein
MKKILNELFEHRSLSKDQAKQILLDLSKNAFNEHELSAFMTVFLMRTITMDELMGFREALLELAIPIDFEGRQVMDIVGTGGDGKNTFNISTLSCFIVAGAGHPGEGGPLVRMETVQSLLGESWSRCASESRSGSAFDQDHRGHERLSKRNPVRSIECTQYGEASRKHSVYSHQRPDEGKPQ